MEFLKRFLGKSIRRKILVATLVSLGVFSLLVTLLTGQMAMRPFYRMADRNEAMHLESRARLVDGYMEQRMRDIGILTRQLAFNLEEASGGNPGPGWPATYGVVSRLEFFRQQHGEELEQVFLVLEDGTRISTLGGDVSGSTPEQWDLITSQPEVRLLSLTVSRDTGEPVAVLGGPLLVGDRILGGLGATVRLSHAARILQDENGLAAPLYVVDSQGRYLIHPEDAMLMETAPEWGDISGSGSGAEPVSRDGNLYFTTSMESAPEMLVYTRVDQQELYREIRQFGRLMLLVVNLGLVVLAFLIYLLAGTFTRPLQRMKKVFERAASGDLFVRADASQADELGQTAASFNSMIERLRQMTYFDTLTGLPNMKYFMYNMETKAAGDRAEEYAILLASINGFKKINETYGFNIGDEVLIETARRLKKRIEVARITDYVARFSGDEFLVFLRGFSGREELEQEVVQIIQSITKPFFVQQHQLSVQFALGGFLFDNNTEIDHDFLVSTVSLARSQAKLSKSSHVILTPGDLGTSQIRQNKMIENDLYRAVEYGELEVYFQPIYDIEHNRVVSLESLLRWKHPEHGYISPAVFIPIAEESGQIQVIGRWVLEQACRQMKIWQLEYPDLAVSVNISPQQFSRKDFVRELIDILCKLDYQPERLNLEITEEVGLYNLEEQDEKLKFLHDWGVGISVDDFGTGYSSFRYLAQLSISQVKIDRSFVRDMPNNEKSKAIVKTIISMSRALKLDCVAEGVETQEQLLMLRELGCAKIQGYLLTRPLPAEEMTRWLGGDK